MSPWWMLYLVAAALPVAAGSVLLARVLRGRNRSERFVWAFGLLLATALPPALLVTALRGEASGPVADAVESGSAFPLPIELGLPTVDAVPVAPYVETTLAVAWALASLLMAIWLLSSLRAVRRIRARSPEETLHGRKVRVSQNLGPAVIGFAAPEILVPEWVRDLPADEARWILSHEEQHIVAADPVLLMLAHVVRVLTPWNPVVWYLSARLVDGIEIDCDRRVLRGTPDPSAYGHTLLKAAVLQPHPGLDPIAAFVLRPRDLERRIQTMTTPSRRFGARELLFGAAAVVIPVLACSVPLPTDVQDPEAPIAEAERPLTEAEMAEAGPAFTPYTDGPQIRNTREVQEALEAEYPPLLRDAGIGGTARVMFFVGSDGRVLRTQIDETSGHQGLDQAALNVARQITFRPAMNSGENVAVWVAMPITFQVR